jgi:glycosyltransferase involved in cell wall biosynthesis
LDCLHVISGDLWAGAEAATFHVVREMARRLPTTAIVLNPGQLFERLVGAGVPTTLLSERSMSFGRILFEATRRTRDRPPQIVHSHRYKEHLLGAVIAAASGARHVRTLHGASHGPRWNGRLGGLWPLLDGVLADWTGSTWIAVSTDLARSAAGLRRTVHVVPNGLPRAAPHAARPVLAAAFEPPDDALYVGFAGRLEPVKAPDRFVRILAGLPAQVRGRAVRGVILGEGSARPRVEAEAARQGLGRRLRLLGHRDDAEALIGGLDVLVVPSDHEGHPVVLLEAMRASVPVVASAVGGIREVLGAAPWLFPPEHEREMARAVLGLLEEPEQGRTWGRRLRALFEQSYGVERTVDRLIEIYGGSDPWGASS